MFGRGNKANAAAAEPLELTPRLHDVVFGHIPKTAGTSVRNTLSDAMPAAAKFFDYGDNAIKAKGDVVNAAGRDEPLASEIVALRTKGWQRRPILVAGHFPLRRYLGIFHPASFVTFVRDPVARVVSDYKYRVRHMGFAGSLADFYETPRHINVQSQMLYGVELRSIGFVGLSEQMPQMLEALSSQVGLPLRMRADNISPEKTFELNDADRRRIAILNEDDLRLYEHVKANLPSYTNLRSRPFFTPLIARGAVKHFRDGLFRGVVTTAEPGRLAAVDVQVDGVVVHRCYADEYRATPAAGSSMPQGRWGFTVNLPMRIVGAARSIRFVLSGGENDFAGSPFKVVNGAPTSPQKNPDKMG